MDIPDIIPLSYFSEFFQIPIGVILLITLFLGYISVKFAQRKFVLPRDMDAIDSILVLSLFGMTWFLRLGLCGFWLYQLAFTYFNDYNTFKTYGSFALMYTYGLIVFIILSSTIDLNAMRRRPLITPHNPKPSRYWFLDRARILFEANRFKTIIFLSIGFSIFLSIGFFSHGFENLAFSIFYFSITCFAVVPSISLVIILENRLLSRNRIN